MTVKLDFSPTPEQQAIVEAANSQDSLMVNALAGCSKTTSLQLAGARVKVPALALAFNKKIAKELEPRFAGNFSVKTINGLGHGAWARANPGMSRMEIDDKKLGKLVSQVSRERKINLASEQWDGLRRLVSGAMLAGITPQNQGNPLTPDTRESWGEVADGLWMDEDEFEFLSEMASEVLVRSIDLARKGIISFDDQIYCSTCLGGVFPKFPVVFVDEAQDLSPLNHKMVELSTRQDGRIIAVGDPKQAIYSFRGADSASMDKIRALRPSWQDLPLKTTFRCPKSVVARQQSHAPGFTAWHTNAEGKVASLRARTEGQVVLGEGGWKFADVIELLPAPTATLVILCRNNGPLLSMAFKLLRAGIGVVMLGRDIGKGLISLASKIVPEDDTPADIVAGKVKDWIEHETSLARANGHDERLAGIYDRGECLMAVLYNAEVRDAGQLRAMLKKLFERESGLVTLSSIHRAKGLEFDLVIHLDPWRIPSKWAREAAKLGDVSQLQQEFNLRYVAETRTKHTLANANLEDFNS